MEPKELPQITKRRFKTNFDDPDKTIRRPLLAMGTKAECCGIIQFLTIGGHAFSYQALLLSVFRAQIPWDLPRQIWDSRFVFQQNLSEFKLVFKTEKPEQRLPRPPKKQQNSTLWFIINDLSETTIFAIPPHCENLDLGIPSVDISIQKSIKKMTWKQTRKNKTSSLHPKSWYTRVPKPDQNRCKSCLWPPCVHPAAPMVLQGGPGFL